MASQLRSFQRRLTAAPHQGRVWTCDMVGDRAGISSSVCGGRPDSAYPRAKGAAARDSAPAPTLAGLRHPATPRGATSAAARHRCAPTAAARPAAPRTEVARQAYGYESSCGTHTHALIPLHFGGCPSLPINFPEL